MKVKVTILVLFAFVISANFSFAREGSGVLVKKAIPGVKVKKDVDRPHLTKGQLIRAAINRERSQNNLEPLLKSQFDEQYPGIDQVPGGGDIFDTWHVTFDAEADFLSFDLVDLSGDGNDWYWNEVAAGDPANAAVAPEPAVGTGREEAIQTKVGVAKKSDAGDSYRVANLILDLVVDEGDPDDNLEVGVLEGPKWHLDDFASHTAGDSVWWVGDKKWDTWGYANRWLEYLDTNPIDLTSATAPTLSINTAWALEGPSATYGWDAATVFAISSPDADYDTWTEIVPDAGYTLDNMFAWNLHWGFMVGEDPAPGDYTAGNHGGWGGEEGHPGENWHTETFDLSPFIGQTIIIRFALAVDECYSSAQSSCEEQLEGDGNFDGGWWLDDIKVTDGGDNLVTDLTPDHDGPGFEPEPWTVLDIYNADAPGTGSWQASYNITRAIIGSFDDSLSIRFLANFDEDNDAAPDGGFEVSDALLRIYTRLEVDAGATFVDLVDAAGDSILLQDGYAIVGQTYDPVTTIDNFGLTDIPIWSAYLEIENSFGNLVYQEFEYLYNDTLFMYPDFRDFTFPAWTPAFEGDYTLRAYFELFGGDDDPDDDAIEVDFHAYGAEPDFMEDFNAPTTDSSLFADGWTYETTYGDTSLEIADYFGRGDTEAWWTSLSGSVSADSVHERLISPAFDCSQGTDYGLRYQQSMYAGGHPSWIFNVQISNDGTNWTTVKTTTGASASSDRHGIFILDISDVADGESSVQVALEFIFEDTLAEVSPYGYSVADDITIYANADIEAPAAGPANLAAVAGDMLVDLSWDAVGGDVMKYSVYGAYDYVVPGCELAYVEVIIVPDDYPGETSWDITDATGTVVASGDADGGTACLDEGDYTFTIYDSYGDGMDGSYTVIVGSDALVDAPSGFSGTSSAHAFTIIGTSPGPDMIETSDFEFLAEVSELTWTNDGLDNETTYHYYVTATDYNGNESDESETVSAVPADVTPPTTVTDLDVVNLSPTSSKLVWTAPFETVPEEGSVYEIRWANAPITDSEPSGEGLVNWDDATIVVDDMNLADEGSSEGIIIDDLLPGIDDYFALIAIDEAGNASDMSNVVNNDHVPPAMIGDLEVVEFDETSITFSWTAPGDDDNNGAASEYDFRVAFGDFPDDWDLAVPLDGEPDPMVAGTEQVFTVSADIYPSYAMSFAVIALDNNDNESTRSNIVSWRPDGIVPSEITEVSDIPEDQGHQVRVSWTASENEGDDGALNVEFYSLWRLIDDVVGSSPGTVVASYIDLFNAAATAKAGDQFRVLNPDNTTNSDWDFIAAIPAHDDALYHYVAGTLYDSTNVDGMHLTTFMVSAHSELGYIANSAPADGYSVDNLAPSQVAELTATSLEEAVLLSWDDNVDEYLDTDLDYYAVYRSLTGNIVDYVLIGTTEVTEFLDENVELDVVYYYQVSAFDFSGNEGVPSDVVSGGLSVDSEIAMPESFSLRQNYPNPFNPTTTIEFALPEDAKVVLTIYNMLGQEIRRLAYGDFHAGYHKVVWDGKDNAGLTLTSGLYIYRISAGSLGQAGDFTKTMKMVLLK